LLACLVLGAGLAVLVSGGWAGAGGGEVLLADGGGAAVGAAWWEGYSSCLLGGM